MSFVDAMTKIENSKTAEIIRKIFSSRIFPFVVALVMLVNYYVGAEIFVIYLVALCAILIIAFSKDITPLFPIMLCVTTVSSLKHSPFTFAADSGYFSSPAILIQIAVLVSLVVVAAAIRLGVNVAQRRVKMTPAMWVLAAFAIALVFNGSFAYGYKPANIVFGLALGAIFFGVFTFVYPNIKLNAKTFEYLALSLVALSALLTVELAVLYMTNNVITEEGIQKGNIVFGWGTCNNFAALVTLSIPAVFYLAWRYKHGYLLILYATVLLAVDFLSMSKQNWLGGTMVYAIGALILVIALRGTKRIISLSVLSAILVSVIVGCVLIVHYKNDYVMAFLDKILKTLKTGSGRTTLYYEAWHNFLDSPLFGVGFYTDFSQGTFYGFYILPKMCHNTVLQLMSASGILGIAAYGVHRVQTIISFFKKITPERVFIGVALLGFVFICLLDNHIFYPFFTVIYSFMVAILFRSEKDEEEVIPKKKKSKKTK